MRNLAFALLFVFTLPALAEDAPSPTAAGKLAEHPDALAINAACADEAKTAGCGDEKAGAGLLKCLHAYKKEHKKEFKFSDACKESLKKARGDMKAAREERKAKREERKAERKKKHGEASDAAHE